jgi:hypothetical protein
VSVVSDKHLEIASMLPVPPILKHWLVSFTAFFTRPTWERVLAAGTVLAPGQRTVTAALSVHGRRGEVDFARFHAVLTTAPAGPGRFWLASCCAGWSRCSFRTVRWVVGIDETIERR